MKIEAFYSTFFVCPACSRHNTTPHLSIDPQKGVICRCLCGLNAPLHEVEGHWIKQSGTFPAPKDKVNFFAIVFTCDECANVNIVLPDHIEVSDQAIGEDDGADWWKPEGERNGWRCREETPSYNGKQDLTESACKFCGAKYELVYPMAESTKQYLREQGYDVPKEYPELDEES
jgi:transcription elongation factor Elf1